MISYQQQQHYYNGNGKIMTTAVYVGNQRQETTWFDVLKQEEGNAESKQYKHSGNKQNIWILSLIFKTLSPVQSWSGLKQGMHHCISTQKSSMMQFGVKERLDGDKSSMDESQDIGWNTKATRKHHQED